MTSTEVAQRTPTQQVVAQLRSDEFKQQVSLALPGNIRPERFVRAVITAIMQNPEVVVHPETLFQSAIRCAQDGLIPDGREAVLVVVKDKGEKKVAYWPMIGGYRKIAAKHGITLVADVVREHDHFTWAKVPPTIEHRPALGSERGEILYAYAAAFDRDWRFVTSPVVMDIPEIEKIRKVSRAATSEYGPWVNWFDRMACKTVARRLFGELPLGDLEEIDARIVEAANSDADLPILNHGMTSDEADITASLTTRPPADDDKPHDVRGGTTPATPEQHATLLGLVVELTNLDGTVDWQAHAAEHAQAQYEQPLRDLTAADLDAVLDHLREQLAERQAS